MTDPHIHLAPEQLQAEPAPDHSVRNGALVIVAIVGAFILGGILL